MLKGAPLTGSSVRGAGHGPEGWTGASQGGQGEPGSPSQDEPAQPLLLPSISPGWGGGRSLPGPLEPSRGEGTALNAPRPRSPGLDSEQFRQAASLNSQCCIFGIPECEPGLMNLKL